MGRRVNCLDQQLASDTDACFRLLSQIFSGDGNIWDTGRLLGTTMSMSSKPITNPPTTSMDWQKMWKTKASGLDNSSTKFGMQMSPGKTKFMIHDLNWI